ncbi:acyltransferase family protein [Nocardiopsis composta]|uniref:Peptidoglycan/LPS O-acetylase OafA/YrhL n=1 Tax=Nocardiopsis composta TaxID=157465 RepID=A0A7W8VEA0_9ACTN|nr:peptidoglycan/LPS O-acetylase OafA/YrhL [Nocardiopsis composta]
MQQTAAPDAVRVRPPAPRPARPADGAHRPEIDGLRAVAVLLVAAYHVWFGRVSGGVDVFLMLTGFLITGSLVRSVERGSGIRFGAFLARLAARLVPTAAVVLGAVLAGARLLLPEDRWHGVIEQTTASALYHLNWTLALDAVDYLARDDATSPVQHFWSLSIQGQFYLLWPVLIAVAAWLGRRFGAGVRPAALAALAAVFAGSLAYSVWITAADQPWAYFDTGARLWEFALGGALALLLTRLDPPRRARVALGWLGLAALVSCGLLLQVSTLFPGYVALWPTLAAAAVIAAGTSGSRLGADRLLTLRPLRYLGSISYALYLWHWPVLVFYLHATDRTLASPHGGAAVLAASIALAAATAPVADRLARIGRAAPGAPRRALLKGPAVALACLLPVLAAAGAWSGRLAAEQRAQEALLADASRYPGAAALAGGGDGTAERPMPVYPAPAEAADDAPITYADGCNQSTTDAEVLTCVYGADDAERTIALVGGSHSAHWFPALEEIAERRGWRIVNMVKGACLFTDAPQTYKGRPYTSCQEWNRDAVAELAGLRPDAVFTTGTTTSLDASAGFGEEEVVDGYLDRWRELEELGIDVIAVRDTPRLGFDAPECLAAGEPEECTADPELSMAAESPLERTAGLPGNVVPLDLTDLLCTAEECPAVVGNVLVYWDSSHIGATYMRTMAPELERRLLDATGW